MSDKPLPKHPTCKIHGCDCDGTMYMVQDCHPNRTCRAALTGDVVSLECSKCGYVYVRLRVTGFVEDE
jgi:hypothetical protein